jgi:hypothetical protein
MKSHHFHQNSALVWTGASDNWRTEIESTTLNILAKSSEMIRQNCSEAGRRQNQAQQGSVEDRAV